MPLSQMQYCLAELYGLDIDYCVEDFLITDRALAQVLGGSSRQCNEELLILDDEAEEDVEVSLFLERELLERLERNNPVAALSERNLADFLVAFEGVSHFTYFAYKASREECVTRLEMELQAEVDKFITTALLIRRQGEKVPAGLHEWLFGLPRLDHELSPAETERYQQANRYAARYCSYLWPRLRAESSEQALRRELRRFYRLPSEHKIGVIQSR